MLGLFKHHLKTNYKIGKFVNCEICLNDILTVTLDSELAKHPPKGVCTCMRAGPLFWWIPFTYKGNNRPYKFEQKQSHTPLPLSCHCVRLKAFGVQTSTVTVWLDCFSITHIVRIWLNICQKEYAAFITIALAHIVGQYTIVQVTISEQQLYSINIFFKAFLSYKDKAKSNLEEKKCVCQCVYIHNLLQLVNLIELERKK